MRNSYSSCLVFFSFLLACSFVVFAQNEGEATPGSHFVFVNDNLKGRNALEAFSMSSHGALIPLPGSPFTTKGRGDRRGAYTAPRAALGATGEFLYIANDGSGDISIFRIDPTTGTPTLQGSPVPTGGSGLLYGIGLAASPDGRFLFAGNGASGNVGAFSIDPNGLLTAVNGSPFASGGSPDGLKVTPDSKFLMVAQPGDFGSRGNIVVFSIAADGSLSQVPGSPFSTFGRPTGIDINCSGQYLFAGDGTTGYEYVEVYTIGPGGVLTSIPGSPFEDSSALNSNGVLLSPDGNFLYVTNQQSETATTFAVASDGALTPVATPASVDASGIPAGESIDPTGKFIVAGIESITPGIAVLASSNGLLSPVPGSPFSTIPGSAPDSVVAFPGKSCP